MSVKPFPDSQLLQKQSDATMTNLTQTNLADIEN